METLLEHKRSPLGLTWEAVILGAQALGYAIFPAYLTTHAYIDSPLLWLIGGPLLLAACLSAFLTAWLAWGKERITLADCHGRIEWSLGLLRWRQAFPLREVKALRLLPRDRRQKQNDIFGFGHRALAIITAGRPISCCISVAEAQVADVASRLLAAVRACGGAAEQLDAADEAQAAR